MQAMAMARLASSGVVNRETRRRIYVVVRTNRRHCAELGFGAGFRSVTNSAEPL
jgi:hypothetical protein